MKKTAVYLICALVACSCVYPFDVETIEAEDRLVIEGDVIVGGETMVTLRYMQDIDKYVEAENRPSGYVWIEDSKGNVYEPATKEKTSSFSIDTRDADPALQYRLHARNYDTGETFTSSWRSVCPAPQVEDLYYALTDDDMTVKLDLAGSSDESHWYRWDYTETWEYVADFAPTMYYDEMTQSCQYYNMRHTADYSYYYCWNSARLFQPGLATSQGLPGNRVVDRDVVTYARSVKKLSSLYRIELTARGISKDAYDYYKNMYDVSSISGSLFSPNPSDILGNIRCDNDSTKTVMGYIDACTVVRDTLYIKSGAVYKSPNTNLELFEPELTEDKPIDWYHEMGYSPVFESSTSATGATWAETRCVDCRLLGGSKDKPEGWPTDNE